MIFYRLSDKQVRSITTLLMMAPFVIAFLAAKVAEQGGGTVATGFVVAMAVLLGLIVVQLTQSRRLNVVDRENARG